MKKQFIAVIFVLSMMVSATGSLGSPEPVGSADNRIFQEGETEGENHSAYRFDFRFGQYYDYDTMLGDLQSLESRHPDICGLHDLTANTPSGFTIGTNQISKLFTR